VLRFIAACERTTRRPSGHCTKFGSQKAWEYSGSVLDPGASQCGIFWTPNLPATGVWIPHRAHLFSLRVDHALREVLSEGYSASHLIKDGLAGLTVGIIAIPLAITLAIASGVPPQYGLYTAIVAGFLIAQTYGLGGLLMATVMTGVILILLAVMRLGRLIEYIPEPVTLGFTGGIAVVIALLQVKDFLGLSLDDMPEHTIEKVSVLVTHLDALHGPSLIAALTTLAAVLAADIPGQVYPATGASLRLTPKFELVALFEVPLGAVGNGR